MSKCNSVFFLEKFDELLKKYEMSRTVFLLLPPNSLGKTVSSNKLRIALSCVFSCFSQKTRLPNYQIESAPLNEFRNALFHIFKCFSEESPNIEREFKSATSHYSRGLYDAFELYVESSMQYIANKYTDGYNLKVVNDTFPEYSDSILKTVNQFKYDLAIERVCNRKDIDKSTALIVDKYNIIREFNMLVEKNEARIRLNTRKHNKNVFYKISGAALIGGALGLIIKIIEANVF